MPIGIVHHPTLIEAVKATNKAKNKYNMLAYYGMHKNIVNDV